MPESTSAFMAAYGRAFDNPQELRRCYGDASIASAPEGVFCLKGESEVTDALAHISQQQVRTGIRSLTPLAVADTPIDDRHVWTKVKWEAKFEKTGDNPIRFDCSYLLRKTGDSYQIVAYVSHQNETEMRHELGLT